MLIRALFVTAVFLALPTAPGYAQIGFQATLDTPPSFVSPYAESVDEYSAALYPQTFPYLSSSLQLRPKVVSSNFDNRSLTLNTNYYSRSGITKSMIPVSVDAEAFVGYRTEELLSSGFSSGKRRAATDAERERQRGGLGINIGLPKRLDKIFGEGGAGLKVSGFRRITFGGRSQWTDAAESETIKQNRFPSLKMEQISRFDITGTIGSKITVKVSQDSQTDIPLANRIQIRYKGDDDDILKTIEAGNTNLSLPRTQFVGYSSHIRGLFGIKAEAQLGRLNFTAIASQEKGSAERVTITPGGEEGARQIRDYLYQKRRIFDLLPPGELEANDSILTLRIYESTLRDDGEEGVAAISAHLYWDPANPDPDQKDYVKKKVNLIDDAEYSFYNDANRNRHYVYFRSPRSQNLFLGYYMEVKKATGDTVIYGNIESDTALVLKVLSLDEASTDSAKETWSLMWRNCYDIGKGLDPQDLKLKILKGYDGTENTSTNEDYQTDENGGTATYINILGLDLLNTVGDSIPDERIDEDINIYNPDWGLLIFPQRAPFAPESRFNIGGDAASDLIVTVPNIYNTNSTTNITSQYYIQVVTESRSSQIRLGKANIIENSERITLDGVPLVKGTDYNIDYNYGSVTLLSDNAMSPNANLSIDFEYAPFFSIQKKSLLGARAEYEFSDNFSIGSTFLYKSDKAQDRKPRVGQETARTIVFDSDMSLRLRPSFLTKVADALPLIETETASNFAIEAEVAKSYPNPNVNDVAWVDDFESAQEHLTLGTTRVQWHLSSKPYAAEDSLVRGRLLWHSPEQYYDINDIYPGLDKPAGETTIRTLRLVYQPKTVYVNDTTAVGSWAGMMRFFNNAVDASRLQLFEARIKNVSATAGKLHFDFGVLDEDVNGNGTLDNEDKDGNGVIDESEDTGLDGLMDSEEPGYDRDTLPDPNGDNWYFNGDGKCPLPGGCPELANTDIAYYQFLNGTEGNMYEPEVQSTPDKEQYASNSSAGRPEAYFSFVVDLSSDDFRVPTSNAGDWWTYRIPVTDTTVAKRIRENASDAVSWDAINNVRVWLESEKGDTNQIIVEIADWYFVQSNWQDSIIYSPESNRLSDFYVATVSQEDDTAFTPPPGVDPYENETTNTVEAQKALLMHFEQLDHRDSCLATKKLLVTESYSGYRRMQMYAYGDFDETDAGKLKLFFRLGSDSLNYYENYKLLYTGWDERNFVDIDFNEITGLKDVAQKEQGTERVVYDDGVQYRIVGKPNINQVLYFAVGLISLDSGYTGPTGNVWLDELRVTDVRKDVGTAGRVMVNGNVADLFNYNFSFQSQDPYFRGLSSSTRGGSADNLGSGKTQTTYTYGGSFNIDRFLPRSWGAKLPVSFSHSKSVLTPLLRTNTDIVLPEETRKAEQDINVSNSVNVSAAFNRPGGNPLFSLLLNRLKAKLQYGQSQGRSVSFPYRYGESYTVSGEFDFSVKKVPKLPILFWTKPIPLLKKTKGTTLSLYPDRWTTSGSFSRNLTITDDAQNTRRTSVKRDLYGKMDINYKIFDNLSASFGVDSRRDLSDLDQVNVSLKNLKLGTETRFNQRFSVGYDPRLFTFLTSSWSYKGTYGDDWQRTTMSRNSTMSRAWGVSGKFDHIALFGGRQGAGGDRTFRSTGGGRGARGATGGKDDAKEKDKAKGKPFYDPPLAALRFLTGWIDPVGYNYGQTYNNSVPGMVDRPNWRYRLGFEDEADVDLVSETRSRVATEGESYEASSGFSFLGGLNVTAKYHRSISRDLFKQGTRYENITTNWPDLGISIKNFKKFPLIKKVLNKFIDVFAPRTNYSKSVKETRDINRGFITSRSTSIRRSPLLSVNFKMFKSMSLNASYSINKEEKQSYNPNNGNITSETRSSRKSFAATTKYSFSAPYGISIPLLGKMKLRSTVEVMLTVRTNTDFTETSTAGAPFVRSVDKNDLSVEPELAYTFSRQIRGGVTFTWQDTNNNYRNQKLHSRELKIWTEITF